MLEIGDGTWIDVGLDDGGQVEGMARTRVRGGGCAAGRSWFARITGRHAEYGMARDFLDRDTSELSRSGASGAISWHITGPGLYEFGRFASGSSPRTERHGYVEIWPAGTLHPVSPHEATVCADRLQALRHQAEQAYDDRIGGPAVDWTRFCDGARDALRAAVGGLAVADPVWRFWVVVDTFAVDDHLAATCWDAARDTRLTERELLGDPAPRETG